MFSSNSSINKNLLDILKFIFPIYVKKKHHYDDLCVV